MPLVPNINAVVGAIRDKFNSEKTRVDTALSGKANTSHTHAAADVTSGTFNAARIPAASEISLGGGLHANNTQMQNGSAGNWLVTAEKLKNWEAWIRPERKRVVFVGSSNTMPGTWPEKFMDLMDWRPGYGYTIHNHAISGSGFTENGYGFSKQIDDAYASIGAAEAANVGYVFFGDFSNDVRSVPAPATFRGWVASALRNARTKFPNARVIILPLIWPAYMNDHVPDAFASFKYLWGPSLHNLVERARYEAHAWRCEFVEDSWTWMTGHTDWMQAMKDVHPNATGYTEVARWMAAYMRGESTTPTSPWFEAVPADTSYYELVNVNSFQRLGGYVKGWTAHISGAIASKGSTGPVSDFARFTDKWIRPIDNKMLSGDAWGIDRAAIPVTMWGNGTVRANYTIPSASTLFITGTYQVN